MELCKGICFFCSNKKVVSDSKGKIFQKIKSLFNDTSINYEELKCITPPKACPVCYHKINTLKKINEDTYSDSDNCLLCGNHQDVIKVSKWNVFDDISSDFSTLSKSRIPKICAACIFYLDIRNLIKEKLLSTYSVLKVPGKSGSKFESNIMNHSTPIIEKRRIRKTRTPSTVCIDLTKDEENISFKPLKHQKELKLNNSVHDDYKFMNQVLIIKLHTLENGEFVNNKNKQIMTDKKYNDGDNKIVNSKSLKTKSVVKEKSKKRKIIQNNKDSDDDALSDPLKKKTYFKIKLKNKPGKKPIVKKFKAAKNIVLNDFNKIQLVINLERMEMSKLICIEENILNGISTEQMEPLDERDPLEIEMEEITETKNSEVYNSQNDTSDSEQSVGVEESVISLIKDIDNDLAASDKENATVKQLISDENNSDNIDKNGKDLETETDIDAIEETEDEDEEIIVGDDSNEKEKRVSPENMEDREDNDSEIKETPVLEDNDINKQNGDIINDVDEAAEQSLEDASVSQEDTEVSQDSEASQEDIEKNEEDADISQIDAEVSQEESDNSDSEDLQKNTVSNNKDLDLLSDLSEIVDGTASLEIQSDKLEIVTIDTSVDSQEEDDFVTGKRKRSDSSLEVNSERKKKKVTFSEDTVSND